MIKVKRWKVAKIGPGAWAFHHSRCPAKRHICFRGLLAGTLCGVRDTQAAAFKAAASRFRYESYEWERQLTELAPPLGWPNQSLAFGGRLAGQQDTSK